MSTPSTKIVKSITLSNGERFVLPSNATIVATVVNGVASVSSTCEVPAPLETRCFTFTWEVNTGAGFTDAYFSELIIKDNFKYPITDPDGFPSNLYDGDGNNDAEKLAQAIALIPNFAGEVIAYDQADVSILRQIKIRLPYMGVKPLMKLVQPAGGNDNNYYVEGVETGCEVPEGWTEF